MRKAKEIVFALVSLLTVVVCGLGCVAIAEKYVPDYEMLSIPLMFYAWFLAGKGYSALETQLKEKWDKEEKRIEEHQTRKESKDD